MRGAVADLESSDQTAIGQALGGNAVFAELGSRTAGVMGGLLFLWGDFAHWGLPFIDWEGIDNFLVAIEEDPVGADLRRLVEAVSEAGREFVVGFT